MAGGPLRGLALAPSALRRSAASLPAPGTLDILTVGEESLISLDVGRGIVDVRLDLAAPALVRSPEYPLLVSGLVDLALGRETSAGVIAAARNPAPARIAPRTLVVAQRQASGAVQQFGQDLSGYLIGAVLGLLCLDALVLLIRHAGQSRMLKEWQPRHAR